MMIEARQATAQTKTPKQGIEKMNTFNRINLINAAFNDSDCGVIRYYNGEDVIEITFDEWDGGDLPFVTLYAKKHFSQFEAEKMNEYADVWQRYADADENANDFDDVENEYMNFWDLPENENAATAYFDGFPNESATLEDLREIKPGAEYWTIVDPDWANS